MPKEIVNMVLQRGSTKEAWGFKIIGGKDQSLTVKVGNVKPYSNAEKAGLKTMDYIWQINGKEVFELGHNDCVAEIKNAGTSLTLATERYLLFIFDCVVLICTILSKYLKYRILFQFPNTVYDNSKEYL